LKVGDFGGQGGS